MKIHKNLAAEHHALMSDTNTASQWSPVEPKGQDEFHQFLSYPVCRIPFTSSFPHPTRSLCMISGYRNDLLPVIGKNSGFRDETRAIPHKKFVFYH